MQIHSWEVKAENYFIDLQSNQMNSLALPNEYIKEKAKKYLEELNKVKEIESYFFLINKYRVEAIYLEYNKDLNSLLELCDQTLKKLNDPLFKTNVSIQNINLRKTWALIQLGNHDEVVRIGTINMQKLQPGAYGWYLIAHYKLKALLYKADYKNAVDLICQMIGETHFSKLAENYQELFRATLGYVHLIVNAGLAGDPKKIQKTLPEFRIAKFLNTIPVFSKDKRGINVSILLMHIAFLLQRKKFDAIIDRIDSLNQYARKYLRKDDTYRSNCMIKMVIQMTKADFHPVRTERYTRDLFKQLQQVKLAGSGENIETEIIPYEVLWDIMVKSL
jgi:hypothetical protein